MLGSKLVVQLRVGAVVSFVDQALISITNFLVGLFFIHFAPKEAYGWYTIGFGVIILVIGIGNATITTPMTVNSADRPPDQKDLYCTSMLLGQWIGLLIITILFFLILIIIHQLNLIEENWFYFGIVIGLSSLCALLREFFRRYNYLKLQAAKVLMLDISFTVCLMFFLLGINLIQPDNMHLWVLSAYGLASCLAGLAGLFSARFIKLSAWQDIKVSLKEAWMQGRWSLGGVIVTWVQTQSINYFLVVIAGAASVAELSAARLFLAPVSMINTSLNNVLVPQLTNWRSQGQRKSIVHEARKLLILILSFICIYVSLIYLAKGILLEFVFSQNYAEIGPYILAWGAVIFFQVARSNSGILLQVFKKFREIMVANFLSAVFVVIFSFFLIQQFLIMGGIVAQLIGEVCLCLLLWRAINDVRKQFDH